MVRVFNTETMVQGWNVAQLNAFAFVSNSDYRPNADGSEEQMCEPGQTKRTGICNRAEDERNSGSLRRVSESHMFACNGNAL